MNPRSIDPARTFDSLVDWTARLVAERDAPGLIMGISGTDSALAFLVCARAMERLGRGDRVMGVHYGAPWPPPGRSEAAVRGMLAMAPNFAWEQRSLMPHLAGSAPQARLVVDGSFDYRSDPHRWADLLRRSLNGALATQPLVREGTYWVVGTRNATEEALLTYSNASRIASLQPLVHLWKGEVLQLCAWLGIPRIAMERSRQVDCDCGRFELAASHIEAVDAILMARTGLIDADWPDRNIDADVLPALRAFVEEQIAYAGFKREIPYRPGAEVIQCLD